MELVKAKIVDGFEFNFGNEEPWERRRRGLKALNLVHDGAVWSVYPDLEKLAEVSQGNTDFEVYTNICDSISANEVPVQEVKFYLYIFRL